MAAIVVTGASTGIGRACVGKAVAEGARVFANVRRQSDADSLIEEFGDAVTPIIFDVTEGLAVRGAAAQVGAMLGEERLLGLVNNAGVAVPGPLLELDADELRRQFEVNFFGVHTVTQAFAPLIGSDLARTGAPGRIVMVSSVGGETGSPFLGPYCASKFALEGYAQSLRRELLIYGIDVIVVAPGAIATPIWKKAENEDLDRFKSSPYRQALEEVRAYMMRQGERGLPPEDVASLIWHCMTAEKPKTRYAILRQPITDRLLPKMMPSRIVDRIIAKRLGLARLS